MVAISLIRESKTVKFTEAQYEKVVFRDPGKGKRDNSQEVQGLIYIKWFSLKELKYNLMKIGNITLLYI